MKLHGVSRPKFSTEIVARAVCPSTIAVSVAMPSPIGVTVPSAETVATRGSSIAKDASPAPVPDPGVPVAGLDEESLAGLGAVEAGRGREEPDLGGRRRRGGGDSRARGGDPGA